MASLHFEMISNDVLSHILIILLYIRALIQGEGNIRCLQKYYF